MIESKNMMDMHKHYKTLTKRPIPLPVYRAIVNGFMKFIMRKIFEGFEVELSNGLSLGKLAIRGKKLKPSIDENGNVKGLSPDWKTTKEMWAKNPALKEKKQLAFHFNEHSSGIRYRINWSIYGAKLVNKSLYTFVPSRENKRTLPVMIRQGKDYFVIEN